MYLKDMSTNNYNYYTLTAWGKDFYWCLGEWFDILKLLVNRFPQ